MAAAPDNDRPPAVDLETFEGIVLFRALEEALEIEERRLLAREQRLHQRLERQLTRQKLAKGRVEIGERRLALIGRLALVTIAIVSVVISALLGLIGALDAELAAAGALMPSVLAAFVSAVVPRRSSRNGEGRGESD